MPTSVLLPQLFLPRSAVNLGRFVTNVDEPHQNFYDANTASDVTEKVQTQYDSLHRSATQRTFASDLTSLLSSSFSKRSKTSIRIIADQVKTYYLNNTSRWFREAVQSEETRRWIEKTIDEGEVIYVVVGYHTIFDAQIMEQYGGQGTSDGNLGIPVSTALAATGIVVPFGNLVDPGLAGSRGRAEDEQRRFVAQGEQICAVQYRKLRLRWLASSKLDKMKLAKGTRWERYDRPRYLESDGEDMIEVELEDDLALENDREECKVGLEEDIFFSTVLEV
ncbi:hypothetical protein EPUS_08796 [Endocarpon pusillum Z07020]|uniref:Uncharacterized protein n=1 Tax=Endocarpon pusillum (strain Z07020 / HMAS-L-300199) TaxID=1263415 RepID=U1HRV5_ENDPU|nr:uncharacterized protein EPUS_08796 [Endocarpon pusillum Z07020]ERF73245.1 hypothetical protein EPUS_08796 [Endocarpon pusillum Z07020]